MQTPYSLKKLSSLCLLIVTLFSHAAQAVDLQRGRELHQENCTQCHASIYGGDGNMIYLREDRRIDSLDALNHQVRKCKNSLGFSWPEDQIDDLVAYLNKTFYHFE